MARALTKEQLLVWKDRIARQEDSGLVITEFCRQESVSVANFHHWKRKLAGQAKRAPTSAVKSASADGSERQATFVQVSPPEPRSATWIEIVTVDGTQIRLPQENLEALELALAAISGLR